MVTKAKVKRFEVEKLEGTLDFELGDEVFHAKPKLSGITLINFVRGIQQAQEAKEEEDGASGNAEVLDLLLGMLRDALGEKEYDRFNKYTQKEGIYVSMETVLEIAQYLVGEYAESPTEAS